MIFECLPVFAFKHGGLLGCSLCCLSASQGLNADAREAPTTGTQQQIPAAAAAARFAVKVVMTVAGTLLGIAAQAYVSYKGH
jgi:hypothetical protein